MIKSIIGFACDCRNAEVLADFDVRLLGLEKTLSGNGWAGGLHTPQGVILAFQAVEDYVPPVGPRAKGEQQQMPTSTSRRTIWPERWSTP